MLLRDLDLQLHLELAQRPSTDTNESVHHAAARPQEHHDSGIETEVRTRHLPHTRRAEIDFFLKRKGEGEMLGYEPDTRTYRPEASWSKEAKLYVTYVAVAAIQRMWLLEDEYGNAAGLPLIKFTKGSWVIARDRWTRLARSVPKLRSSLVGESSPNVASRAVHATRAFVAHNSVTGAGSPR